MEREGSRVELEKMTNAFGSIEKLSGEALNLARNVFEKLAAMVERGK